MATASLETSYSFLAAAFAVADIEVEVRAQESLGDREDCTDEGGDIIFSDELSHAQKVAMLKELRRKTIVGAMG